MPYDGAPMDAHPDPLKPGPPPEWRGENLIFLVGCPRSGTTWLQQLLGAHPAIATAQESHLFNHILAPIYARWDRLVRVDMGRRIGLPAYLTEGELDAVVRCLVHQVLSRAADYAPGRLFLEKTPGHILHIALIDRVFPAARFIHLLRRPADVVESLLAARKSWGRNWAPRNSAHAAYTWRQAIRAGQRQLAALDPERWRQLRYESLREDPGAELERLLGFLGLEGGPEILARMLEGMGALPLYGHFAATEGDTHREPRGFRRSQKGRLGPAQRLLVHLICQPYKGRLGY